MWVDFFESLMLTLTSVNKRYKLMMLADLKVIAIKQAFGKSIFQYHKKQRTRIGRTSDVTILGTFHSMWHRENYIAIVLSQETAECRDLVGLCSFARIRNPSRTQIRGQGRSLDNRCRSEKHLSLVDWPAGPGYHIAVLSSITTSPSQRLKIKPSG